MDAQAERTAHLVSVENGVVDLVFRLDPRGTTLGRESGNLVQVTDSNVSKHHAMVKHEDGAWFASDLGSTNGTYVNGERITRKELHDGDRLVIGRKVLLFAADDVLKQTWMPGHVIDLSPEMDLPTQRAIPMP